MLLFAFVDCVNDLKNESLLISEKIKKVNFMAKIGTFMKLHAKKCAESEYILDVFEQIKQMSN